jgi:4-amino-4-deoxy-L-arabinose transferase-like glycosyltransferase
MTALGLDERPAAWHGAAAATLLAVAALLLLAAFHVGFQASDDASYLAGALGWLESFPYVGTSHWTLRHTITLPTALLISVFGLNELAVSLSNVLYFMGFLVVNAWFMHRHLGGVAAAIATALMIVLPGFTVVATYLNSDIPELFFVCSAFWLVITARQWPERSAAWLLAGLLLGAAFVTRQTAVAAVVFVGVLFLFFPAAPRSRYLPAAAAFLVVIAADWLYLTVMTGEPLYRFHVDFNHDRVDRFAEAARVAQTGGLLDKEGNLSVNVFLDPFLALFVSQKYGLLFWLAVPALLSTWRLRRSADRQVLMLAAGLALAYFVFVAINPKLYLVPRYLIIVAWCAAILAGAWLARLWSDRRRAIVVAALGLSLGVGILALSVENINPRFVERQLVDWVSRHPGRTIHADPETAIRSRYYFRFAGQPAEAVSTEAPGSGATVLASPERLQQCAVMPRCKDRVNDFRPGPEWTKVESAEAPPRPIGRWLRAIGLEQRLPADISRRLFAPGGRADVYTVGPTQ